MRRILVMDYGLCNFHNLIKLAESGHRVFVATTSPKDNPESYYHSLGITIVSTDVTSRESIRRKFIEDNRIDTLINTIPMLPVPDHMKDGIDYIGHSKLSSRLECNKWETRKQVEQLGIKVPKLLNEITLPCVVKPRVVLSGIHDIASIFTSQKHLDWFETVDDYPDYYVEEYIPDNIESNVEFVISGGKWSIIHHQQVLGEDTAKMAGGFTHWTRFAGYKNLSDENRELTLKNAEIILDYISTLGGDYVGQITGLIKDGEWYFCEINGRPEQSNSLPQFITGDEWLESMHGKPEILGDSFPFDVQKVIVQPSSPDVPYPFHLHEKYDVSIPCGLDIIAGKHRLARTFRKRSPDRCIGIIICDHRIPQEFIEEIQINSKYFVSHCFL